MTNHPSNLPGPGSNVKGRAAGAAWTYLLDELTAERVVCIGEPTSASRVTLERIADRLTVIPAVGRWDRGGLPATPDTKGEEADLVYLVNPTMDGIEEAMRQLAPRGLLYLETSAGKAERTVRGRVAELGGLVRDRYLLSPTSGEARTAVPAADRGILRFFVERDLIVFGLHPLVRPLERRLALRKPSRGRVGLMVARRPDPDGPGVPRYLVRLAGQQGLDLSSYRYGLSARGQYNSRKVVFFLFPPGRTTPTVVVKTTRDATFNDRLVSEEAALQQLASRHLVPRGTVPEVAFSGEHGGLRILAETVVDGTSMRNAGAPVESAYRWLTDLAVDSAERGATAAASIEARLATLAADVPARYPLTEVEAEAIRALVDEVRGHSSRIPTVLSHGDAATWNAVRMADGRIGFLDWEAGHADGIPLWDLWYFARSHVMSASRVRRRLGFRGPDVLTALRRDAALSAAVKDYTARLEIPAEVVKPLFALCWADRALREVTRIDEGRLAHGHYVNLLRRLLAAT